LGGLAGSRREIREERSHGKGKGLTGFIRKTGELFVRRYPIQRCRRTTAPLA
jgi:hypothetical protein